MASQTLDQQISTSSTNGSRTAPVGAEIPVNIQGSRPMPAVGGVEQAPVPFVEQTNTVIVFANGAVIRLTEGVFPGQILILKNLKNDHEAACRVISSKSIGNVQGYVEVEFTHQTSGFWDGDSKPSAAPSAAPADAGTDSLPEAADQIKYKAPTSSSAAPSEDDAMSKALADAFSSLMSPATKSAISETTASPNPNGSSSAAVMPKTPSETMRSPGLGTKIPAIPPAPSGAGTRSSVLSNAKPVAIGDIIGSAPSVSTFESQATDTSYKPPSAYRGIEPRKSSVAPEPPVRAVSRPAQSAVPRVPQRKSGGQWVWMLAGVAASAALMVGGFFGYRWYVGGGAPASPAQTAAATNSSHAAVPTSADPVSPTTAKSAGLEPERVVVKATPLDPPATGAASNSKAPSVSTSSPSPVENARTTKGESQPSAAPTRQSSVLTMKSKMATPKAPNGAARQAAASNMAMPDIGNSDSSATAALPTTALGGSLAAPPGGSISGSTMVQPKLLNSTAPVYPRSASINSIEGDVRIDAIIGINGHVGAMKVLDGPMELRQSAMVAVAQWRYEPAKLDGKAISTHLIVLVKFRLNR